MTTIHLNAYSVTEEINILLNNIGLQMAEVSTLIFQI